MTSVLHVLNDFRITRDLTYDQLAAKIGVTGPALYRLLTVPNARMRDRTRYKIERFLAEQKGGAEA